MPNTVRNENLRDFGYFGTSSKTQNAEQKTKPLPHLRRENTDFYIRLEQTNTVNSKNSTSISQSTAAACIDAW